jgi:aminopeptidase N
MPTVRTACAAVAATATLVAGAGVALAAPAGTHHGYGARGAGDPYYPRQGNGGYEVDHYRLQIHYAPSTHRIRGVETIHATAKQTLTRFDLDLRPAMHVSKVLVGGAAAGVRQPLSRKQELVIRPHRQPVRGQNFVVKIYYAGTGRALHDPDGSLDGWIHTNDGAFVADEPQGSPTWFAVNDTPRDKATYTVSINVPNRVKAIGNGVLRSRVNKGGRTTWTWHIGRPIQSYLVTATVGRFHLERGKTSQGIPYLTAVDPSQRAQAAAVLKQLPKIITYFSSKYGRYPFGETGAVVDYAPQVGYALETATRPIFDRAPSSATLSHELAHQWFGDTVTLKRWRDIWLNEGFAEFSSWLWQAHTGGMTLRHHKRWLLAHASDWNPPPANPGDAADVFDGSVYDRGACALEVLREKVGSKIFFATLRGWVRAHKYGNATVPQFIAYAQHRAHRDLRGFFHHWLYRSGKP